MARKRPSYKITNAPGPNDWAVTTEIDSQLGNMNNSERLERIEKVLEKVCDRLAILEEPTPERLEAFKQLQEVYKKYKFLDELCGEHDGSKD